jgi:hypothetical protein
VHDDGPQVILPAPALSPERVAERTSAAEAVLAAWGFAGARAEDQGATLLLQLVPADIARLQDDAVRDALVERLSALGYTYVALDLTADDPGAGCASDTA